MNGREIAERVPAVLRPDRYVVAVFAFYVLFPAFMDLITPDVISGYACGTVDAQGNVVDRYEGGTAPQYQWYYPLIWPFIAVWYVSVLLFCLVDGPQSLDGRLVQFAGNVSVGAGGTVTGQYQLFGGISAVAEGADVDPVAMAEPLTRERSPAASLGTLALQAAVLAVVSFVLGRRYPDLLANVGDAVHHHPVVSGTVGLLATATLLALFVFMAFTIVLIPVSLLGLFVGGLVYLYAYVSLGYLLGQPLPTDHPGIATAVGAVGVLVLTWLVGRLPVVGGTITVAIIVTAVGAVVVTYFGLREFEPPSLPPAD